jgi:hypothetical protein
MEDDNTDPVRIWWWLRWHEKEDDHHEKNIGMLINLF